MYVCAGGELRLRKRRQSVRCPTAQKENQGENLNESKIVGKKKRSFLKDMTFSIGELEE